MKKILTVGELREVMKNIPDSCEVKLSSDTAVDQDGYGEIIIERASHTNWISDHFGEIQYLSITANIVEFEEEED